MKQIHAKDWTKIGEKLFGANRSDWRFKCSKCGHTQSRASVLRRTPSAANLCSYFSCEGRVASRVGCNYTLGGLFRFHKLEVFFPDSSTFTPVFDFDHPDAAAEIALALMPPRAHTTTDAKTWAEWTWPEWVPVELRTQIEAFYHDCGPAEWLKSAASRDAPDLGEEVTMRKATTEITVSGRFVHRWNNIGAVVQADGTCAVVSW